MSREKSDTELIKEFKAGNQRSFEELIQRYSAKAFSLISRLTRDQEDSEEVLQDVFVTVYRKIDGFEGKASFSSWFYRITVNAAFMKLRKRKQDRTIAIEDAVPDFRNSMQLRCSELTEADVIAERQQLIDALEDAIAKLPDEYRPVFILRDIDGMTSREVSKILDLSVPAVKSRLHRSRLMLRRRLLPVYREFLAHTGKKARQQSAGNM